MLCSRCKCEIAEIKRMPLLEAISKTAEFFELHPDTLLSKRQSRHIVLPRMMLMKYLWANGDGYSLKTIAQALGKKDHTTVCHGIKTIGEDIKNYPDVALQYGQFLNFINK